MVAGTKHPAAVARGADPLLGIGWASKEYFGLRAIKARHRGAFNVGFCDGHAESIKIEKLIEKSDRALSRWNNDHRPHRELVNW